MYYNYILNIRYLTQNIQQIVKNGVSVLILLLRKHVIYLTRKLCSHIICRHVQCRLLEYLKTGVIIFRKSTVFPRLLREVGLVVQNDSQFFAGVTPAHNCIQNRKHLKIFEIFPIFFSTTQNHEIISHCTVAFHGLSREMLMTPTFAVLPPSTQHRVQTWRNNSLYL